jgi:hypothetical protein
MERRPVADESVWRASMAMRRARVLREWLTRLDRVAVLAYGAK